MNGEHEQLDDVAVYVMGMLDAGKAAEVRAHLTTCPICQEEYRKLVPVADALSLADESAPAPSPLLKRRLMRAIAKRPARPRFFYAVAGACAIVVIAVGLTFGALFRNQERLRTELADMTAPHAQHYAVPHGQVVRNGSHVYIALSGAPPPPAGKVYEAWTLPRGSTRMVPSSTFVPREGSALVRLPADGRQLAAVAVSVEPAGGSAQPTTTPTFVVKFF